jgi:hypothetical protein
MGMNFSAIGGQRPLPPLMSTVAPAATSQSPVPPLATTSNSASPSGFGAMGSIPQSGIMDLMRVMVGLISQMVNMLSGSASGNSPFSGALNNMTPGATPSTALPPTAGGSTAVPNMAVNGTTANTPATLMPSGLGYGGMSTAMPPPATATPSATDASRLQQCPNQTGGTNVMGTPALGTPTTVPAATTPSPTSPGAVTTPPVVRPATLAVPGMTPTPATPAVPGMTPMPTTPAVPGMTPTPTTPPVAATPGVADDGTHPVNVFTASDYKNFLLAGSHGGTTGTAESINSKYADPTSRFARTGNTQFQAAIAGMYANQFKGYALGMDVAYTPGKDINKIAQNLTQVEKVQMTPEAEMLSKVAALYRGELTGVNLYDNPKLKTLLTSWGRSDIANQPNVGNPNGDVQSIGGVVKALNEEKNPAIRKAWLQQIFDFAGNSPSSPSGAVPNLPQYQQAINLVRNGSLANLLQSYQQTPGT